jgi:hypothetical protein
MVRAELVEQRHAEEELLNGGWSAPIFGIVLVDGFSASGNSDGDVTTAGNGVHLARDSLGGGTRRAAEQRRGCEHRSP